MRIFTNATRIDRILARQIAGVSPLAVEVSIYGAHAEAHDAVAKRPRTLRRTLRGLVHMRDAGVRVGLKAPLKQGESFPLTLHFANSPPVTVEVKIAAPGAAGPAVHTH